MLRVMDGNPMVPPFLHYLDRFHKCDAMLKWLIDSRLTGNDFMAWVRSPEIKGSMLEVSREILRRMERAQETRAILYGRDLR